MLFVLLLSPLAVFAENPQWYPQKGYELNGIIQQLDIREREIIISDDKLSIASGVKVHSMTNEYLSLSSLKVGDAIGVDITEHADGKVEIVEIWLLDKDKPVLFSSDSSGSSEFSGSAGISDKPSKKPARITPKVTR